MGTINTPPQRSPNYTPPPRGAFQRVASVTRPPAPTQKEPAVPAATRDRRRAAHRAAEGSWSSSPPPRGAFCVNPIPARKRLQGRGESRGGSCPQCKLSCPLWPSLLLSRERERRSSTKDNKQKIDNHHIRLFFLPLCGFAYMQLPPFPLRQGMLFRESRGFSKGARFFVPAGTEQGFHPCTPPGRCPGPAKGHRPSRHPFFGFLGDA